MRTTPHTQTDTESLADAWLARLRSPECSVQERAVFEDWLAESPAHIEAYLQAERMHAMAAAVAGDELLRMSARRERRRPAAGVAWRHPQRWLASAAVLALAVGAAAIWWPQSRPVQAKQFATAMGEQRKIALDDGTTMWLDTASAVAARYDERERVIELRRGRAQFEVGPDPDRPFLVLAGPSTIRDIGTTFQVSRDDTGVNVALLEGQVEVSVGEGVDRRSSMLAPGEQIAVGEDGRLQPKRPLDLAVASGWPKGDLVFKQRRLDQLLDEMNRYSPLKVRLAKPALGELIVSGVFHAGDQDALVAALEHGWSLRAVRTGENEILLHPPRR